MNIDTSTPFGERVARRLRDETTVWLVTTRPDGTPEPSPVWFHWDGEEFLIYSLASTARQRNIPRNPNVALHFDSTRGTDVVVFGGRRLWLTRAREGDHEMERAWPLRPR